LTSNTTYYVLMDTGFFKDAGGGQLDRNQQPFNLAIHDEIRRPRPSTATNIVVAGDGSGDFVTVQGAIDWVRRETPRPIAILLRKGTYEEINRIPAGKNNLTFIGEGWQESVIATPTTIPSNSANAGTATRIMFFAGGNDLVFQETSCSQQHAAGRLASRGFAHPGTARINPG